MLLVYGALFIGVLLTFESIYHLVADRRRTHKAVNRRVAMLDRGVSQREVLRQLRRQRQENRGLIGRIRLLQRLDALVTQSGSSITTERLTLLMALITVGVAAILFVIGFGMLHSVIFGLMIGIVLPTAQFEIRRRRRIAEFGRQLPDAIDLIVRSLRSGQPLAAAISVVAEEMADPIGTEFGIIEDEATYGLSLPDAVENMAKRVGHGDLHYFLVAIRIQYGTGGNLAEILTGLSRVIRDRFNMLNKIQAVSAEGRLSSLFLSGMPLAVFAAVLVISPDYYLFVYNDPLFWPFVYVTIGLIITNLLVMRRLVNFKV